MLNSTPLKGMNLKNASILVIDDDQDVLTAVRLLLKTEVKNVVTEKNPQNLRWLLSKDVYDVILLDMNFTSSINTGNEGIFWLNEIKKHKSDTSVIMITAYGDIDLAVKSLKEGATDFVIKPWHNEKLLVTIKGAFTDAREDRMGRFEMANGGTLFLDEIANISLHQQAKLLNVLQNRQISRIGSNELIPVDIRLICATNVSLGELANENRFRKDLIYRINTFEITMPPLRKRENDIILLAKHFAKF